MNIQFWHEWRYWLIGIGIHHYSFHDYWWNGSIYIGPFRIMISLNRKKGE